VRDDNAWQRHLMFKGSIVESRARQFLAKHYAGRYQVIQVPMRAFNGEDRIGGNADVVVVDILTNDWVAEIEIKLHAYVPAVDGNGADRLYRQYMAQYRRAARFTYLGLLVLAPDMEDSRDELGPHAQIWRPTYEDIQLWRPRWRTFRQDKLDQFLRVGRGL
jgi:hypothetical protein